LRQRTPQYEYARDFGGIFYLFIRGMSPRYETGTGIYFHRPQKTLIEELARLFATGEASA
jgi:exodeoxyribonuclease V beta subunit